MKRAILGIDAAWTVSQPSGVALIQGDASGWSVVALAPSYASFVDVSRGLPVNWSQPKLPGNPPRIRELIDAARKLTDADLSVVAVDMPMATVRFSSRRQADTAISKAFGGRGCAAHSPTAARPGALGASLTQQLASEAFALATTPHANADVPRAIEVYPHPALLSLLGRNYRVPYKVARSAKYWRGALLNERISRLLEEFRQIASALERLLGPLPMRLPSAEGVKTLASLKRYEDALDAVICGWVGTEFLAGRAVPYGDESAAIWVPR